MCGAQNEECASMTFQKLLERYEAGMIVSSEFVPEALSKLSLRNVQAFMRLVPADALRELAAFIEGFDPKSPSLVIGNVSVPSAAQLELARRWLRAKSRPDKKRQSV